jgi:hypothetical protein
MGSELALNVVEGAGLGWAERRKAVSEITHSLSLRRVDEIFHKVTADSTQANRS